MQTVVADVAGGGAMVQAIILAIPAPAIVLPFGYF